MATPKAKTAPSSPSTAAGAPKSTPTATPGYAVAVKGSGAVALPADLAEELAGHAKEASAVERPKLSKISFKSGMMSYMQQPVPGDAMDMILLAAAHRNTWYAGSYDPDNIVNPTCFAIKASRDAETELEAHENVKEVPADSKITPRPSPRSCVGCSKHDWGTAMRDGKPTRGKACKEGRRILVVPASVLTADDPVAALKSAEKAVIDIPVTSVAGYGNFVNALAATMSRPMWSVVTNVKVVRDVRTQFKVVFTPIETINDAAVIRAIKEMLPDAERIVTIPYDETELLGEQKKPDPVAAKKTAKFKG